MKLMKLPKWATEDSDLSWIRIRCKTHGGGVSCSTYEDANKWIREHKKYHKNK
jgi:hypothetical protein